MAMTRTFSKTVSEAWRLTLLSAISDPSPVRRTWKAYDDVDAVTGVDETADHGFSRDLDGDGAHAGIHRGGQHVALTGGGQRRLHQRFIDVHFTPQLTLGDISDFLVLVAHDGAVEHGVLG